MKRSLLIVLALILSMGLALGGTMAYLQDTDEDVNVMTLGNVYIVQNEQERDAEGELQPFTQDPPKPLYPAVYTGDSIPWADAAEWPVPNDEAWKTVEKNSNVVDKFVTVTNIGDSEAYVRTIIAYEADPISGKDIHIVQNAADSSNADVAGEFASTEYYENIVIDGARYDVIVYTYKNPLAPGATTIPSLKQVYLDKTSGNEEMEAIDTNGNGTYDIYVLSQAVQTMGFADAESALDEAFGEISSANAAELFAQIGENIGSPGEKNEDNNPPTFAEHWDGTIDTSWYNDTDTEFVIETAEQLAGLAELVDKGNSFAGKTVKLGTDICLGCEECVGNEKTFDPIGDEVAFEGTFDGADYTIKNLFQNGWDLGYEWGSYGSIGLFGELKNATVKNLTITGAESFVEGGDVGGITGSATGKCTFENITIEDSVFATYNNGNGGIIGWSGDGEYTFKNITIAEDVVLAGLWGSFDSSIGGVVGQGEPGATYNFENVDIACRLDVYNDVTASYDYYNYRMCGMIIGRLEETTTIDGVNYPDTSKYNITCKDVTVTYEDWANYHYCRAAGARGKRVEAGYSYDGIAADYDHSVCTVHHQELIEFDQIFGGDQYGVKGLKAYDGVTVVYNNK